MSSCMVSLFLPSEGVGTLLRGCFPSLIFQLFYHTSLMGGWVARIFQGPWEWSPSGSWLLIAEAPGCLRHPTLVLCKAVVNILDKTAEPLLTVMINCTLWQTAVLKGNWGSHVHV